MQFNSPELQEAIKTVDLETNQRQLLDEFSEDVRQLEQVLSNIVISAHVPVREIDGFIAWARSGAKHRLVASVSGADPKPLLECKATVRLAVKDKLPALVKKLGSQQDSSMVLKRSPVRLD